MSLKFKSVGLLFTILTLLISFNLSHSSTTTPIKETVKSPAFKKLVKGLIADDYTRVLQALNEGAPYKTERYKGRKIVELAIANERIETLKALIDYTGVDNLTYQRTNFKRKKNNPHIYSVKPIIAEAFLGLYFHNKPHFYKGEKKQSKVEKRRVIFYTTLVDYILTKSPNINATFKYTSESIRTPLSIAAEYNDLNMVKRLLKMGANPNLPAYDPNMRRTVMPLGGAGRNNNIEMLSILLEKQSKCSSPLL